MCGVPLMTNSRVPAILPTPSDGSNDRFGKLDLCFGFMDEPNASKALMLCKGFKFEIMQTSFYLGRRTLIGDPNTGLPWWQDELYIALAGLGIDPSTYLKLPANRVVEIGEQVTI